MNNIEQVHVQADRLAQRAPRPAMSESYRQRWNYAVRWAEAHDMAMPLSSLQVRLFLHAHYPDWSHAHVKSCVSAIAAGHLEHGWADPRTDRTVADYVSRLRRELGSRRAPLIAPLLVDDARRIQAKKASPVITPLVHRLRALLVLAAATGRPLQSTRRPIVVGADALQLDHFRVDGEVISGPGDLVLSGRLGPVAAACLDAALRELADGVLFDDLTSKNERGKLLQQLRWVHGRAGHNYTGSVDREALDWLLLHCDPDVIQRRRDLCYLLVGLATASRHATLADILIERIEDLDEGGYLIPVARDKTLRSGRELRVQHQDDADCDAGFCAACALDRYLEVLLRSKGRTSGWLFGTQYRRSWNQMTRTNGANIIRSLVADEGLSGQFATRSLRAGAVTTAARLGWDIRAIMEITDHQDPDTCRIYVRQLDPFSQHLHLDL